MKRFFVFIAAAVLSASSVYAGGKIGVRDGYADEDSSSFKREQGRAGQYIVYSDDYVWDTDLKKYVDADKKGNWIEDKDGNDLIWINGEINGYRYYYTFETYDGKESGIITKDMWAVNLKVYDNTKYQYIYFSENAESKFPDKFAVIAAMDGDKNKLQDPADTRYTTYFDENGVRIDDIYKYIASRDRRPEEGSYLGGGGGSADLTTFVGNQWQSFVKYQSIIGGADVLPGNGTPNTFPRIAVGKKGHYLVGNDVQTTKKGGIIEAEDGTDLYFKGSAVVIDEEDEIYCICYDRGGKDSTVWALMNSDLKEFGASGYNSRYYYRIVFGDLKVYAMSADDPSNTKSTKYFDADGNKIDDIYKYLETHGKDPSSGRFEIRNRKDVIVGEGVFGQEFDPELLSKNEIPEQSSQTVGTQNNNTPYTYGTAHFVGATQIINAKTFLISALLETIKNK